MGIPVDAVASGGVYRGARDQILTDMSMIDARRGT